MHLLWELGVDVRDRLCGEQQAAGDPQVRDRIAIGSTSDAIKAANAYDLVICREVLEHLTVFQIKKTVENMVRMTSRFIYCTTRFHPSQPVSSISRRNST